MREDVENSKWDTEDGHEKAVRIQNSGGLGSQFGGSGTC